MIVSIELEHETCWCGTPFMLPKQLRHNARNHGHTIYCPQGHTIVWKETELERTRRERDRLKQDAARLEDEKREAWATANAQAERAAKAEGESRRLKKRAAAGVCPCCNRTFTNMRRHMKTKHPNVVPLDQKQA